MSLYPLRLMRRYESRLWGGNQLATWLNLTDAPTPLAETWEVFNDNLICAGELAGQTLRQAVLRHGADLVGARSLQRYGHEFPLLAKFIDANQPLSVQVHPDDTYAHHYEAASGFHGKTEAWHIIATTGHNDVIHGLTHPVSRDDYAHAIATSSLEPLLRHIPVVAGDTVFVPAGTIHAINAGILLFEIQQTSDLTYRVYDYARRDTHGNLRELHIPQAIAVSNTGHPLPAITTPIERGLGHVELVRSDFFVMEKITTTTTTTWQRPADSFQIITLIAGGALLSVADQQFLLTRGQSLVIPANTPNYTITPQPHANWLRCWVPDA
ncbi:MAG: class I mannose-6-phosphate isomerase [Chloroflexales bacterium]|nr:class I mannose-6-phosphate isomerase [Chloroflexales bacterium]